MNPIFSKKDFKLCCVPVPKGYPQSQTHVGIYNYGGKLYLTSSPFPNPKNSKFITYLKALARKLTRGYLCPIVRGEYFENPCLYISEDDSSTRFRLLQSKPLMDSLDPYYGLPAFNSDPDIFIENGCIYVINRAIYRTKLTPGLHRDEYEIHLYLIYGKIDDGRFKYLGTKMMSESTELSVSPCLTSYNGKYILMQLYTNCYNDGVSFDGLKYQTYDKLENVGTNVTQKTIQVNIDKYIPWHMSLFHYEGSLYAIISCVQKGIDHKCYQMLGRFTTNLDGLMIFDKPLTDYNSYRGAAYVNSRGEFCLYSTTVNERIKHGKSVDGREIIYAHKPFKEILNMIQ